MTQQRSAPGLSLTAKRSILRRAAERAGLAPSIYNTQPWRFVLTREALEIHVDAQRRLRVLDPRGRQLTISCGAALYNARVAIAAAGYEPVVERFPEAYRPNLVARVAVGPPRTLGMAALDREIDRRHTNRRPFMGEPPASFVRALVASAAEEGATVVPMASSAERARVAALCQEADAAQRADAAYITELLAWTTDDPRRTDGVQAMSIPYIDDWAEPAHQGQIRSFDVRGKGWLPSVLGSGRDECRLVFCAVDNSRASWLRVGEALQRVWLELTWAGYWASPLNQAVEVPHTHRRLRDELGLTGEPQILLRVGLAPEAPATPRRPLHEVVDDRSSYEEQP